MSLFSKEKGIVLSILNAVLLIWILAAIVVCISNLTNIVIKDYSYNYDDYKIVFCNLEYETEDDCKEYYKTHIIDLKGEDIYHKRNALIAASNVLLVSITLIILNINKKKEKAK